MAFDLIFENADVIDGTGVPARTDLSELNVRYLE